jgi:hypothetical protein
MTQQEITRVGNTLIALAESMIASGATGADFEEFFDGLEAESRHIGGDESMPLGWVADAINSRLDAAGIHARTFEEQLVDKFPPAE